MHSRCSDHALEDFAEVYVPWDILSKQIAAGNTEVCLSLGLKSGVVWLGTEAKQSQYRAAFDCASNIAKHNPLGPQLQLSMSMVGCGSETGSSKQMSELHVYRTMSDSVPERDSPQELVQMEESCDSYCKLLSLDLSRELRPEVSSASHCKRKGYCASCCKMDNLSVDEVRRLAIDSSGHTTATQQRPFDGTSGFPPTCYRLP